MAITLTPYFNLRAFRLGENIVFSNLTNIKCYFTQFDDRVEVEISLCAVHNDALSSCQDLAVIDFPHSRIDFDNDNFYSDISICDIWCGNILTEQYVPDEEFFVIDISNLIPKRNNVAPSLQSQTTTEENDFIKRVIGENRPDVEYQVIDLNLILSGLEDYIKDNLIIPIIE
jgi:hypothetical protein